METVSKNIASLEAERDTLIAEVNVLVERVIYADAHLGVLNPKHYIRVMPLFMLINLELTAAITHIKSAGALLESHIETVIAKDDGYYTKG